MGHLKRIKREIFFLREQPVARGQRGPICQRDPSARERGRHLPGTARTIFPTSKLLPRAAPSPRPPASRRRGLSVRRDAADRRPAGIARRRSKRPRASGTAPSSSRSGARTSRIHRRATCIASASSRELSRWTRQPNGTARILVEGISGLASTRYTRRAARCGRCSPTPREGRREDLDRVRALAPSCPSLIRGVRQPPSAHSARSRRDGAGRRHAGAPGIRHRRTSRRSTRTSASAARRRDARRAAARARRR